MRIEKRMRASCIDDVSSTPRQALRVAGIQVLDLFSDLPTSSMSHVATIGTWLRPEFRGQAESLEPRLTITDFDQAGIARLKCANGCADRADVDISNVALDGLHRAEVKLEKAATRIASFGADSSGGANTDTVALSAEMLAVMSAKGEVSANLKRLETAGEEQKKFIDLIA